MQTVENNFWVGIDPVSVSDVKSILQTQASYLGKMSKNVVEANVRTELMIEDSNGFIDKPTISHCFDIITPLLGYKRFTLFCVNQLAGIDYPLNFYSDYWNKDDKKCECKDKESFEKCLKEVLSAPQTVSLINSVIAQSI